MHGIKLSCCSCSPSDVVTFRGLVEVLLRLETAGKARQRWQGHARGRDHEDCLTFTDAFNDAILPRIAPLLLHLARYHELPSQTPGSFIWAAALIGCVLTVGWQPMPTLLSELISRVPASVASQEASEALMAVFQPLLSYRRHFNPEDEAERCAAQAALTILCSSHLLTPYNRGLLIECTMLSSSSPPLMFAAFFCGRYIAVDQRDGRWPLPLPSMVYFSHRAGVRLCLLFGADPSSSFRDLGYTSPADSDVSSYKPLLLAVFSMYFFDMSPLELAIVAYVHLLPADVGSRTGGFGEEHRYASILGVMDDLVAAGADVNSLLARAESIQLRPRSAEASLLQRLICCPELDASRGLPLLLRLVHHGLEMPQQLDMRQWEIEGQLPQWPLRLGDCDVPPHVVSALVCEANWSRRKHWIGLRQALQLQEDGE